MGNLNNNSIELLQNLIRFDTSNPPGNEIECIKYLNEIFTNAGFETQLLAKDPNRPNLITRLKGKGKTNPILLYAHVDVVTTENQIWKYPPFEAKIAEGYLWGRGTLDMKGAVVMMISALLRAKVENITPPGDVIMAIVSDEEYGSEYGTKYLVENHSNLFEGIKYAIGEFGAFTFYIGKKKFYPIMISEKALCFIKITVRGPSGHGSLPLRGGATAKLGALLSKLDKKALPVHITETVKLQADTMASNLSFPSSMFIRLLKYPLFTDKILKLLGSRAVEFDALTHNTVNVVSVHGGEQIYGIPSKLEVTLSVNLLPGYAPEDIISELKKIIGNEYEYETLYYVPIPEKIDMGLFETLKNILNRTDPKGIVLPILIPGSTDGRFLSKLGIQTYGFTPMILPEEINFTKLIHGADERIPIEAIEFGVNNIYELLKCFK
ncbi:MAG: M20/M25/M40 family metallo-hydrolase [Actinobacteria bacterium]|nr:M20/M25/M40 family metallo-hydrolase [Actinomycetota bacterium]